MRGKSRKLKSISRTSIVSCNGVKYPKECPYDPEHNYIEFGSNSFVAVDNAVYGLVRKALLQIGLDKENIGTKEWSPFKELICPGDVVIIKPNMVIAPKNKMAQEYVTTHASVIRPIIDYVWKALQEKGEIIIGDAPQAETDFEEVIRNTGIKEMIEVLKKRGVNVRCCDFRDLKVEMKNGIWIKEVPVLSHPESTVINLAEKSLFYDDSGKKIMYCGGGYDVEKTRLHHNGKIQEYKVSDMILKANVVISMPKMKTHKKAGITCCMKNLVGINVDKDFLPHYTMGDGRDGGDEMPIISNPRRYFVKCINYIKQKVLYKHWRSIGGFLSKFIGIIDKNTSDNDELYSKNAAKNVFSKITGRDIFQGAWSGNDTIWKMILDLNRIFLYADRNGELHDVPVRKVFYVVDGIICGAGDGPMEPIPVETGFVAVGDNAYDVDISLLELFNIDYSKIPLYRNAYEQKGWLVPYVNSEKYIEHESPFDKKLKAPTGWEF